MNKKSESAVEFLATYGWAFIVILVMVGALAYFGVLDTDHLLLEHECMEQTAKNYCEEQDMLFSEIYNAYTKFSCYKNGEYREVGTTSHYESYYFLPGEIEYCKDHTSPNINQTNISIGENGVDLNE